MLKYYIELTKSNGYGDHRFLFLPEKMIIMMHNYNYIICDLLYENQTCVSFFRFEKIEENQENLRICEIHFI